MKQSNNHTQSSTKPRPVIGITGHTGGGASSFAKVLEQYGALIISADKLAHEELEKTGENYCTIIETFGTDILAQDGNINRSKLAALVFGKGNEENRKKLEGIIHPAVLKKTREIIEKRRYDPGIIAIVIDAPLLIESGLDENCDSTVFVNADKQTRVKRIMKRDEIDYISAVNRIESRIEPNFSKIDIVIDNNGSYENLHHEAKQYILSQD